MRLRVAVLIAALSGFIALSYEIIWVRVYGFATEGEPEAFAFLLTAYLAGGSLFARRYCERAERSESDESGRQLHRIGAFLLAANVAAFPLIPAVAELIGVYQVSPSHTLPLFGIVAGLLGTGFPLLAHFAIRPDARSGARLSYLYVGNILGSTCGSLLTGLWLLDVLTLRKISLLLAISGASIGCLLMAVESRSKLTRACIGGGLLGLSLGMVALSPALHDGLFEKLNYQEDYYEGRLFAETIERRSGIINRSQSGTVYGGGSYDGETNVIPLPELDNNRVLRAYLVSAFHAAPKEILMIGLGAGSWLQVLANYEQVERITVVEIDAGYVEMMRRSPEVASAVDNPKVEIVIDDGRRYLGRTSRRFDVIVQNTPVYWRAHASNLMSIEHLASVRSHLAEGGVFYYGTTGSTAAHKTGVSAFPEVVRYQSMLIASEAPIRIDTSRFRQALDAWQIDGRKVLPQGEDAASLALLHERTWHDVPTWEYRTSIVARTRDAVLITDDNMATEWGAWGMYPWQ